MKDHRGSRRSLSRNEVERQAYVWSVMQTLDTFTLDDLSTRLGITRSSSSSWCLKFLRRKKLERVHVQHALLYAVRQPSGSTRPLTVILRPETGES